MLNMLIKLTFQIVLLLQFVAAQHETSSEILTVPNSPKPVTKSNVNVTFGFQMNQVIKKLKNLKNKNDNNLKQMIKIHYICMNDMQCDPKTSGISRSFCKQNKFVECPCENNIKETHISSQKTANTLIKKCNHPCR